MTASLYFGFVLATSLLILLPGPNVALIVANSVAYGSRYGLLTVLGTVSASALQLLLTAAGMTAILGSLVHWFDWVRWIGAAYLLYLGLRQWRAPATDLTAVRAQPKSVRVIMLRAFLVSLTNPKTLLFYGAFLPQFINPHAALAPQFALLAPTYLVVALLLDSAWAMAASRARGLLASRGRLRNRLSGGMLMGAGVGLALARSK